MYSRALERFALATSAQYPIVTVLGPRQSGKSTFARMVFPDYGYVSLETPADQELASNDPNGFFLKYPSPIIIDEVQRVPSLLSEIQTRVDATQVNGQYVLTGSHQLLLMESIAQTLAGRTSILTLLPLSLRELQQHNIAGDLDTCMFTGGYPRIYDQDLEPSQWLAQYIRTYVERDVRQIAQLKDLATFQRFLVLCAGRVGQLLNWESLASDCGVTGPTAKAWLSLLETSFIVSLLRPHHQSFGKRVMKSPKIYFYDTGLLCALLRITQPTHVSAHPLRGAIFENMVFSEMLKSAYNRGVEPQYYFWRDARGREVDFVIDRGHRLDPVEVKAGATFARQHLAHMKYFNSLQFPDGQDHAGVLVYGGDENFMTDGYCVQSWQQLSLDES